MVGGNRSMDKFESDDDHERLNEEIYEREIE